MNHFYVGQEVVCIDAGYSGHQKNRVSIPLGLEEGRVYKIRWLGYHRHYVDGDYLGIRLEGVDRGICEIYGDHDTPYRATRFKPVVKDPIAVFRNILAPQPGGGEPHMPWAPEEPKKVPAKPLVISVPDRNCKENAE